MAKTADFLKKLFNILDVNVFNGKLSKVVVEWGSMTECASVCYKIVEKSLIVIRLSQPLLESQIDIILLETLLHEMIHAYLFINGIDESYAGHGINFETMVKKLNSLYGLNISVHHMRPQVADKNNNNSKGDTRERGYVETAATKTWQDVDGELLIYDEKNPIVEILEDVSFCALSKAEAIEKELLAELNVRSDAIKMISNDETGDVNQSVINMTVEKVVREYCNGRRITRYVQCPLCSIFRVNTITITNHLEKCLAKL